MRVCTTKHQRRDHFDILKAQSCLLSVLIKLPYQHLPQVRMSWHGTTGHTLNMMLSLQSS
eukprot:5981214-Prorocentrum_lima.AAC.1